MGLKAVGLSRCHAVASVSINQRVSIATDYGTDGGRTEVRFLTGVEDFSSPASRPTSGSIQYFGLLRKGVKRPGHEADH